MKTAMLALTFLLGAAATAGADSGPLRDPTGCATGSAVANCRSVPQMGRERSGSSLRGERERRGSSHQRMHTSPLPSEFLPPSSTGLDKGSTGINRHPLSSPKPRSGH